MNHSPPRTPIQRATSGNACLIITNNFPPTIGGAGEIYAAFAAAAQGRIRVLCASRSYLTGDVIGGWHEHDGTRVYPIDRIAHVRPRLQRKRGRLASLLVEELPLRLRLLARVAWLRLRHGCRVICIADDETVGWLIGPSQWLLGCRVMLYSHGDDLAERPNQERLRARRRRQFARADAIVASSNACMQELGRVFGVTPASVTIINNGIDTALFRPISPDPSLQQRFGLVGRRVIVTVSRLIPRKGIDRVIEAIPRVLNAVPEAHYLVVGDGPQAKELQQIAVRSGVAGRVTFAGAMPHADVPRYLALAELMAMPNRRMPDGEDDGLSLIFLEANACGLPVIGGRSGGAPEVVEDGVNGLLVDGNDVSAIADAIVRVLCDASLAARLSKSGIRLATNAGWARRTEEFVALCDRLAGSGDR